MAKVADELREKAERTIIIIDDRFWPSLGRDLVSGVTLLALISVGVLVDSFTLQWVAGVVWVLWLMGRGKEHQSFATIAQARARLDELEGKAKGEPDA